jgi:hypothetical protein
MKRIRDATTIIGLLDGGEVARLLGVEITDVLATLKDLTQGRPKAKAKGEVTLKLKFVVEGSTLTVDQDISSKRPKMPTASSLYWVTDDGSISTEHPQQSDMFTSGPRPVATYSDA